MECGFALKAKADRVSRHLDERHKTPKALRRGLNQLIKSLNLPDPIELPPQPGGSQPHPKLELQSGFRCRHCDSLSSSLKVLDQHLRRQHRDKLRSSSKAHVREDNWRRDHTIVGVHFQSWARNDVSRAWIVLLGDKSSSTARPDTHRLL